MKIFSPHRRRMDAKRRFGSKEFKNKIKKAQEYKRVFDPRASGWLKSLLHYVHLDSKLAQFLLASAFLLVSYYLFISPYFVVTQVAVSGNEKIAVEQVNDAIMTASQERWLFIPKTHLLVLNKSQTAKIFSDKLPLVKEIGNFKRIWPNKAEVEIIERRPGFALNLKDKYYLVDEEGVVVKEITDSQALPLVLDQVNEDIQIGERLNNAKLVAFILSLTKAWPNKVNTQIKEMMVPGKAATQIQAVSNEGWAVFFDTNRSVGSQLANLSLILGKQIPAKNRLKLAYIDLRFDKWAYYCYKDSPCQAEPQDKPADQTESEKVEVE